MTIPKQEERFNYKGFPCVILFMPYGYRCGYVGIPIGTEIDTEIIDCHGGITYERTHLHNQSDIDKLWIGFDCNHCYDGYDVAKVKELYANDKRVMKCIKMLEANGYFQIYGDQEVRTLEYCKKECKKIVEQLIALGIKADGWRGRG